jgi:hypothetical protein
MMNAGGQRVWEAGWHTGMDARESEAGRELCRWSLNSLAEVLPSAAVS